MQRAFKFGMLLAALASLATAQPAETESRGLASPNSCLASPVNLPVQTPATDGKSIPQLKDLPPEQFGILVNCDQSINSLFLNSDTSYLDSLFKPLSTGPRLANPSPQLMSGSLQVMDSNYFYKLPNYQHWEKGVLYFAPKIQATHIEGLSNRAIGFFQDGTSALTANSADSVSNHSPTASAANGLTITGAQIRELSLTTRNYEQLVVLPESPSGRFQWRGWEVQISMKDHGKTAIIRFIKNQTGVNGYGLMSLLASRPPVEAIGIGFSSNPTRAGPTRPIFLIDPFGNKKPKLLATKYQIPNTCGLPRPKRSFDLRLISSAVVRMLFVRLTSTETLHRPVLSSTPLVTPLRT